MKGGNGATIGSAVTLSPKTNPKRRFRRQANLTIGSISRHPYFIILKIKFYKSPLENRDATRSRSWAKQGAQIVSNSKKIANVYLL